jgi:hypothetical protein
VSVVFLASGQLYSPTERVLTNDYGFEVVEYSNPITGVKLYGGKPSPPAESDSAVYGIDWWFPPGLPAPFVPTPPPSHTCCSLVVPGEDVTIVPDTFVPEPSYTAILTILLVTCRIFRAFANRSSSAPYQNKNLSAS